MPHKKAKHSVREEQRRKQQSNLAPGKQSVSNEPVPKSVSRVLNAIKIREDYKQKRKRGEGKSSDNDRTKRRKLEDMKIKLGESLQHFNKRVEDDMRSLVKTAVQASKVVERQVRKAEREAKQKKPQAHKNESWASTAESSQQPPPPPPPKTKERILPDSNQPKHADKPKEFEAFSTSAPRRLNDIAQAPPEIKKTPRGGGSIGQAGQREGVLSMAQKSMMEQEREKAIVRYRMLKASRVKAGEDGKHQT